jgi:ribosomal protein S21
MKRSKNRGLTVFVKDDNVEKALRKFKKKIQESGLLDEVRERMEYVKPNIERTQEANKARRRWLKKVESDEIAGRRVPRPGRNQRKY